MGKINLHALRSIHIEGYISFMEASWIIESEWLGWDRQSAAGCLEERQKHWSFSQSREAFTHAEPDAQSTFDDHFKREPVTITEQAVSFSSVSGIFPHKGDNPIRQKRGHNVTYVDPRASSVFHPSKLIITQS